jgi:putative FmdB family regulatory protein
MALYDFECQDCGHVFEMICKYDDSLVTVFVCPRCMSENTKIQMPAPSIVSGVNHRSKIPQDFREGVLEPMKKFYSPANPSIDNAIKV